MKINVIIPGVGLTGGMRVIFKYAEFLKKSGHDVVFYTPIKAYDVKNSSNELVNFRHIITNSMKRWYLYNIKKEQLTVPFNVDVRVVNTICDKNVRDADLIIATAWPTSYSVYKLSESKGKKIYFVQDYEIWNNEYLGKKSYTLPLKKIVISKWINEKLVDQLKCEPFPIVYDGLDLGLYNNKNRKFKKDYSQCRCLMLYHELKKKGVQNGIKAFELAKRKYPNISLCMFGMCNSARVPDYVDYYYNPSIEDLTKLYNEADIFIFPSLEEGWGLTPLEAMLSKCAVVGTETGCLLDIGINEKNALISKPGNIDDMANNIIRLIENNKLLESISSNGYDTVKIFSWENSYAQFESVLKEVYYENIKA